VGVRAWGTMRLMSVRLPIREGFDSVRGQRRWYRIEGDGEAAGTTGSSEYSEAMMAFRHRHVGHDECTLAIQQDLHDRLPGSKWVVFERSAHLSHLEGPERFREVVEALLARVERDGGGGAA
jgi:hypothetical protein